MPQYVSTECRGAGWRPSHLPQPIRAKALDSRRCLSVKAVRFLFRTGGGGGGGFGPVDSEESPIEEPQIIIGADKDISCSEVAKSSPESEPDLKTTESNAKSGWNAVGRAAIAIALVGGILAATGNLPVALGLLKSLSSARQPQPPFRL